MRNRIEDMTNLGPSLCVVIIVHFFFLTLVHINLIITFWNIIPLAKERKIKPNEQTSSDSNNKHILSISSSEESGCSVLAADTLLLVILLARCTRTNGAKVHQEPKRLIEMRLLHRGHRINAVTFCVRWDFPHGNNIR